MPNICFPVAYYFQIKCLMFTLFFKSFRSVPPDINSVKSKKYVRQLYRYECIIKRHVSRHLKWKQIIGHSVRFSSEFHLYRREWKWTYRWLLHTGKKPRSKNFCVEAIWNYPLHRKFTLDGVFIVCRDMIRTKIIACKSNKETQWWKVTSI